MSDEYTIDAKYKRDNLLDEHERYRKALEQIASLKLQPVLDPWDTQARCRRIAHRALHPSSEPTVP